MISGGVRDFCKGGDTISLGSFRPVFGISRLTLIIAVCGGCGAFEERIDASSSAWMASESGSPSSKGSFWRRELHLKAIIGWRKVTKRLLPVIESQGMARL